MKNLWILLLVCKIFQFGAYSGIGETKLEKNINDWIKDKKVISVTQSGSYLSGVITIITEQ